MLEESALKKLLICIPSRLSAATQIKAIRHSNKPYSAIEAPSSRCTSLIKLCIGDMVRLNGMSPNIRKSPIVGNNETIDSNTRPGPLDRPGEAAEHGADV